MINDELQLLRADVREVRLECVGYLFAGVRSIGATNSAVKAPSYPMLARVSTTFFQS